jgi:hypothetical protein
MQKPCYLLNNCLAQKVQHRLSSFVASQSGNLPEWEILPYQFVLDGWGDQVSEAVLEMLLSQSPDGFVQKKHGLQVSESQC